MIGLCQRRASNREAVVVLVTGPMRVNGAAAVMIGGVIVRVLVDEWRRQSSSLKRNRQGEDA